MLGNTCKASESPASLARRFYIPMDREPAATDGIFDDLKGRLDAYQAMMSTGSSVAYLL